MIQLGALIMSNNFFDVFSQISNAVANLEIESYYGPTMSDFMRDINWDQTFDIESLSAHIPSSENSIVIDLGTGDGRIIKRLTDAGIKAQFIGVDSSLAVARRFEARQTEYGFPGTFIQANFLDGIPSVAPADGAVFGSVSINCLNSIEVLSQLFTAATAFLKPEAPLILSCYTDAAMKLFPSLDGVLNAEPYITEDGNRRLMWRGLKYEGTEFLHNAFVDRTAEGLASVLCWERERVWFESDLRQIAQLNGWKPTLRTVSSVSGGGADGFEVATISFRQVP